MTPEHKKRGSVNIRVFYPTDKLQLSSEQKETSIRLE